MTPERSAVDLAELRNRIDGGCNLMGLQVIAYGLLDELAQLRIERDGLRELLLQSTPGQGCSRYDNRGIDEFLTRRAALAPATPTTEGQPK